MASPARQPLSRLTHVYALTVATLGFLTVRLSILDLLRQPAGSHKDWLSLVAFTLISGWLSVKLPSVNASISISQTFVFAGTLVYGPSVEWRYSLLMPLRSAPNTRLGSRPSSLAATTIQPLGATSCYWMRGMAHGNQWAN